MRGDTPQDRHADAERRAAADGRWRAILLAVTAALGAVVLAGLVVTLGEATRQRDRALAEQSHSYDVMILARTLSSSLARAEASLGRYVISGDQQLGVAYASDWAKAGQLIDRLEAAVADNSEQQPRIDALRAAYRTRGKELADTALSTQYRRNAQALARYYQARNAASLEQMQTLLDTIIARERAILAQRTTAALGGIEQSNTSVKVLIVFGILIVLAAIALGWATMRALNDRARAEVEADAERERSEGLSIAVAAATAELRVEAHERAAAEAKLRQVQKMEAVGQLTGGIAHDFNNMLAVVIGGLDLARRHVEGAALRHIEQATEGANRAAALTKRLLAFARAEPLRPEAIAPARLIADMGELVGRTLGGAVAVRTYDDGVGWSVWADRHQLENALLNLAVNGRDAMDGRGVLTITTGAQSLRAREVGECAAGDYVTIAVGDTGCGISPEVMDRVFEPFFTTKPVGQGTGLGLSQIFAFVRQSTGEIAITSEPGAGTTVTLYLPRHIALPVAAPAADPVAPAAMVSHVAQGLDILVVEDDARVLGATMEALAELGHRPVACDDPLQAERCLAGMTAVDLILSDVLMPGLTGPELIASLPERWRDLPVLFVTGFAGELDDGGFGSHAVLRKPFTLAALERAVADAARSSGPARAAA